MSDRITRLEELRRITRHSSIEELEKCTKLWLDNKNLTSVPPGVCDLTDLVELGLWQNQLSSLPPEISQLTRLKKFIVSNNCLSFLPPEILRLMGLEGLVVYNNQLSLLPPEISQLMGLTLLDVSNNRLSSLPPEISRLTGLVQLRLWQNRISSLPPEISRLTRLTKFIVSNNRLSSLPPEISRLTGLMELDVDNNCLSSLPPGISRLTGLKKLSVYINSIEELPPEITALTKLEQLYVQDGDGNIKIKRAPRGITNLPCWNNTTDKHGSLSVADALRKLQLYDPVVAPPLPPPPPPPPIPLPIAPSRLASGRFADVLRTNFEKPENILGKGGFGLVFKAQLKAGLFAVKLISNATLHAAVNSSTLEKDGKMMLELKHSNILTLFDFGYRGKDLLFVMEFADGGDLCSLVKSLKGLGNELSIKYGLHIIQGLVYLHTRPQPIQHRDIKTENILLVNGVAKLTDFGLSESGASVNSVSGFKGSKNWSPPEAFEVGRSMGLHSDVYSYGVVLWSMLTGQYPYEGLTMNEIGTKVMSGNLLPLPSSCPSILVGLIHKCWERNYDSRINAPQVEAELKQVEADLKRPPATPPMTPPTPSSKPVEEMNIAELIAYLESKGANPKLIKACEDNDIGGPEFVSLTEEEVRELVPGLMPVHIRVAMKLIAKAALT